MLLHMLAKEVDMEPYEFIWTTGDTHIYLNQLEVTNEQINREPRKLPTIWLNPEVTSIFDYTYDDIKILDYDPDTKIVYEVNE